MNGSSIPLQNLPSQNAPTNGFATLSSPPLTNGNVNSSTNQPPTSSKSSLRHIFTTITRPIKSFRKGFFSILQYWFRPLLSLAVYALTLYIAWTATSRATLLGRVSPSLGTWILAIFAKAGDICFAFAVEDTFDTIAWRKLKARGRSGGVVKLEWFLSVVSSTGIEGLGRVLWGRFWRWVGRRVRRNQRMSRPHDGADASFERKWRDWWKEGSFSRWSFARLVFIAILIPGPGIILMANIDQTSLFFDVKSINVSAGVATFDPSIANASRDVIAPVVSRYIQGMLQDRSLSWPVNPVTPECKAGKNCKSYLLAGPYLTVAPWPFPREDESVIGMAGFRIRNAPYYQVDLWDSDPNVLGFSQSKDCVIYGGLNATSEYSTLLCVASQDTPHVLAAGWLSCQQGYSPTNGTCLAPGGRSDWATYLSFSRLTATLTFSREGFDILEVTSLSTPQPQNITSAALFTALDATLYRPDRASNDARYDIRSAEYLLTQTISVQLWSLLFDTVSGLSIGRDWLRNLVTLPVYLFQPTRLELAPYMLPLAAENGTRPQANLPAENYVTGSYCVVEKRSVPGRGTVYAYTAVAGLLLAFVVIVKIRALWWEDVGTSDFAVVDYHVLTNVVDERGVAVSLRDRLDVKGGNYGTGKVLDGIADLRIGLR